MNDLEAYGKLLVSWLHHSQAGQAIEEVRRQNLALAQESLAMQGDIDEARNHVAVVRSSEYADVRTRFDDLYRRQEAVLAKLSPVVLLQKLKDKADEAERAADIPEEAFLSGTLPLDKFVEAYVNQRIEFHKLDLMRQAAETNPGSPLSSLR